MSNFAQTLKQEIQRLARKEVRGVARKQVAAIRHLKKNVAELRRAVTALEKEKKLIVRQVARVAPAAAEIDEGQRVRITGKGIRSLRKKWGISQAAFGKVIGVSLPCVVLWEKAKGAIRMREKARNGYLAKRNLGAREVQKILEG